MLLWRTDADPADRVAILQAEQLRDARHRPLDEVQREQAIRRRQRVPASVVSGVDYCRRGGDPIDALLVRREHGDRLPAGRGRAIGHGRGGADAARGGRGLTFKDEGDSCRAVRSAGGSVDRATVEGEDPTRARGCSSSLCSAHFRLRKRSCPKRSAACLRNSIALFACKVCSPGVQVHSAPVARCSHRHEPCGPSSCRAVEATSAHFGPRAGVRAEGSVAHRD